MHAEARGVGHEREVDEGGGEAAGAAQQPRERHGAEGVRVKGEARGEIERDVAQRELDLEIAPN